MRGVTEIEAAVSTMSEVGQVSVQLEETRAAEKLGVSPKTLAAKLKSTGLED